MAGIKPPETPPMYRPINSDIPAIGSIPYVMGRQIAIAIVAVKPGIEPNTRPKATPMTINNIILIVITDVNQPITFQSFFYPLTQEFQMEA